MKPASWKTKNRGKVTLLLDALLIPHPLSSKKDGAMITSSFLDVKGFFMKNEDTKFIEESLKELGLTTDKELEALANLAPNTLSKARQGAQELSAFSKLKIYDLRGYKVTTEKLLGLFGKKGQDWIVNENRRRLKRAKSKTEKGE